MSPPNYRYYHLDGAGRLHEAEWFQAPNDDEAVARIRDKHPDARCEIWQGGRLVGATAPVRLQA